MGLKQACDSRWCLQAVGGHEIWYWAAQFETFTKRNCWAYDGCAGKVSGLRVVLLSPCVGGEVGGSEVLLNRDGWIAALKQVHNCSSLWPSSRQ